MSNTPLAADASSARGRRGPALLTARLVAFVASVGLLVGCGAFPRSHQGKSTQPFAKIPYTSVEGKAWDHGYVTLKDINARYGLPADTKISYVELNPKGAKTLVFIHGLGSYLKFWRYQLDTFAASGYRVLALDMIGYGKSDKPGQFPYTMQAMAEVVRAFVAERKVAGKPVLVGHSMGGQTALSYAIEYPDEVGALVLTAPAGFERFSPREKAWFHSVMTVPLIKSASEYGIWGSVRRSNFYRWKPDFEWLIEERVRVVGSPDFNEYAYANVKSVNGLAHNDFVRESLHKIDCPTIIIHGDMDRLIPNPYMHGGTTASIMAYGEKHIRGAKRVELEGCGHTVQMDCAKAYNVTLSQFLLGLK